MKTKLTIQIAVTAIIFVLAGITIVSRIAKADSRSMLPCYVYLSGQHPTFNYCFQNEVVTGVYQNGQLLCSRIDVQCTRP